MVTVKTLTNTRPAVKNLISLLKLIGHGSLTINNSMNIDYFKMSGPNTVFYKVDNDKIILEFEKPPEFKFVGLIRIVNSITISEEEAILSINYFPDLRIEIT